MHWVPTLQCPRHGLIVYTVSIHNMLYQISYVWLVTLSTKKLNDSLLVLFTQTLYVEYW